MPWGGGPGLPRTWSTWGCCIARRVRGGRAETYRRLGQPERAAADLRTAVTNIESVWGGLSQDEEKRIFRRGQWKVSDNLGRPPG